MRAYSYSTCQTYLLVIRLEHCNHEDKGDGTESAPTTPLIWRSFLSVSHALIPSVKHSHLHILHTHHLAQRRC